ncbi:transposase [Candidatus Methylobacter oryzae]|uniref:Transposase n=1 Tax=Candidatus Methylobacter oryzae TaxID=2497749 RepID=A0ABY3C844_9GAMM|nr:transposase [Candidatus Methylobacter oryzae]
MTVLTPVKKQKGQAYLEPQDQWLSTAVSRVRQPIESLFSWIEQLTGIECAGKVRSYNALMVHVFGKLAAALFFWNYLRVSA